MRSDGPKWQRRAAGLGLASLVFFEIAALCSPSMILVSIQHKQLNVGAFSYASNFGYKPIGVRKGAATRRPSSQPPVDPPLRVATAARSSL